MFVLFLPKNDYMDITAAIKKEECTRLWKEVFGDSDEFISSFMEHFYTEENMLYITENEKISSMLHIIPFEQNGAKVAYMYAVATDYHARGKGYAKKLIRQAIEKAKKEGYKAIFTLPADEGLSEFYSQFGFKGKYPVEFKTQHDFDFGTGKKEKDLAMILPLDSNYSMQDIEVLRVKKHSNKL